MGIYRGEVNGYTNIVVVIRDGSLAVTWGGGSNKQHWYYDEVSKSFELTDGSGSNWAGQVIEGAGLYLDVRPQITVKSIGYSDIDFKLLPA